MSFLLCAAAESGKGKTRAYRTERSLWPRNPECEHHFFISPRTPCLNPYRLPSIPEASMKQNHTCLNHLCSWKLANRTDVELMNGYVFKIKRRGRVEVTLKRTYFLCQYALCSLLHTNNHSWWNNGQITTPPHFKQKKTETGGCKHHTQLKAVPLPSQN